MYTDIAVMLNNRQNSTIFSSFHVIEIFCENICGKINTLYMWHHIIDGVMSIKIGAMHVF